MNRSRASLEKRTLLSTLSRDFPFDHFFFFPLPPAMAAAIFFTFSDFDQNQNQISCTASLKYFRSISHLFQSFFLSCCKMLSLRKRKKLDLNVNICLFSGKLGTSSSLFKKLLNTFFHNRSCAL